MKRPEVVDNSWSKQQMNQKAWKEKLGNEMSLGVLQKSDIFLGIYMTTSTPREAHMTRALLLIRKNTRRS